MGVRKSLLIAVPVLFGAAGIFLYVVAKADRGVALSVKDHIKYALCEGQRTLGIGRDDAARLVPNIEWPTTSPDLVGLSTARLDSMRFMLAMQNTKAFLVARDGRLVYEWYSCDTGPNDRQPLASLAKAVVGGPTLLAALSERRLSLQDPASKYIPGWANDANKSRITIFNLATHSSGLDDVYWGTEAADAALTGWKKEYFEHADRRFRMAIGQVPVIFEPGSRYQYSGIGYYALAYAMTQSLQGTPYPNIRAFYRARIARPLGIPDEDWKVNYGKVQHEGSTELYAIGSGSSFTARAVARIGQLILDSGDANGQTLIAAQYVKKAITNAGLPPVTGDDGKPAPSIGVSWWVNTPRVFPSLPEDAALGAGASQQILLGVPSLHLVAVRLGESMTGNHWNGRFWSELEEHFFRPLMATVTTRKEEPSLVGSLGAAPPAK